MKAPLLLASLLAAGMYSTRTYAQSTAAVAQFSSSAVVETPTEALPPAPPGASAESVWTLDRVRTQATHASPRVRMADAALASVQATRVFANVPVVGNPIVAIRAMVGVPNDPAAVYGFYLGLPIDLSARRGLHLREAEATVHQFEERLDAEAHQARADAEAAFVDAQAASSLEQLARVQAVTSTELFERTRTRLEAQAATELDVSLVARDLGESEADVAAAHARWNEAMGRLREALDQSPDTVLVLTPMEEPTMPDDVSREQIARLAVSQRMEPTALRSGARRARIESDRWAASAIAPLTLGAEYEIQGNSRPQTSIGLSASWQIPIAQTNQGERAVATAESQRLTLEASVVERTIARDARTAYDTLVARLEELHALDSRGLPAAQRALEQTQVLFDHGAVDAFRVLVARKDLYSLRARRLETSREAWQARVALDRAMGSTQSP